MATRNLRPSLFLPAIVIPALLTTPTPAAGADAPWPPCGPFIRGDSNGDLSLDVSDAVHVLLQLFAALGEPPPCLDAADADDSEAIEMTDAVYLLRCLFEGGPAPPPPGPERGFDEPCNGLDDDGDGSRDEGCAANTKDLSKYTRRMVFLVSDEDWRLVVPLVPVATWRGDGSPACRGADTPANVCTYPVLIVHVEGAVFDADSILHFLERYQADRVLLVGPTPAGLRTLLESDPGLGLDAEDIANLAREDFPSYWSRREHAVLVDDDYEAASLAATYAALIDAPLFIRGHEGGLDLSSLHVTGIGDASVPADESLSLEGLQATILELTATDKMILTRPDLEPYRFDEKPTVHSGIIKRLFGKTSLAAPFLAAAKEELIVPAHSRAVDDVQSEITGALERLDWSPAYLTILASPVEIQQTIVFTRSDGRSVTWSIDNTRYGNADGDIYGFAERKTGRIYGFTVSDVSACIARGIFQDRLPVATDSICIGQGVGATDQRAKLLASVLARAGHPADYRTYADPALPLDWAERALINSDSHGSPYYATIWSEQIPAMENTVVFTASCLTCAYDKLTNGNYGRLFCLQLLRQGALAVVASVDTAGFTWDSTRLNGVLSRDLGTTFKSTQNHDHARNKWYIEDLAQSNDYRDLQADIQFLLGDPTLRAPIGGAVVPRTRCEISETPQAIELSFVLGSVNVEDQGVVFAFVEGTDDFVQARYARFFLEAGPVHLFDAYSIESPDVDPLFYGGLKLVAVQEEADGTHVHFLVEKDLSSNPPDTVVENSIAIRIVRE